MAQSGFRRLQIIFTLMTEQRIVMETQRIQFSKSSSVASAMRFAKSLHELRESPLYIFDFQNVGFTSPFTLLFLSSEITQFKSLRRASSFSCENADKDSYPAHMGFFQACGYDIGKRPGQASGGDRYLPITILQLEHIVEEARTSHERMAQTIERYSEQFAKMLTHSESGVLFDLVTFSIREILRNILEHSKSPTLQVCAEYWPKKQLVEVAILDTGIGVQQSLKPNPYLEIHSDRDAINVALLPGVSGKTWKGRTTDRDDPWAHSGYGLFMTGSLCRDGGTFFICSGDSGVLLKENSKYDFDTKFQGTAIRLRLMDGKFTEMSSTLAAISRQGSAIQRKLKGTTRVTASVASRMLARDFSS